MKKLWVICVLFVLTEVVSAQSNSAPDVSDVTASQRTDGSGIVDIYYTLSDADGNDSTVSVEVSNDGGSNWNVVPTDLEGDIGVGISPGSRHIVWNSKTDLPGEFGTNYQIKVIADDGIESIIPITWITINDPGVPGHEGFNGEMSKYEITNAQYCDYLNAALASGHITVNNNSVYSTSGYTGEICFITYEASSDSQISYSNGVFSVRSRDGYDMSNHPVVMISWYGATAFCNYYGYRLPAEWEWQAVADFDGSYIYGCGTSIDHDKANYDRDNPLGLTSKPHTTPVGYYPTYGYGMCDMAGNVWEWTSSCYYADCSPDDRVRRGGSWSYNSNYCTVSYRYRIPPNHTSNGFGFRVVLGGPMEYGWISGMVTDVSTCQPIENGEIVIAGMSHLSATSDSDGYYEISGIPFDNVYSLQISAGGYKTGFKSPIQVTEANPLQMVDIDLTPVTSTSLRIIELDPNPNSNPMVIMEGGIGYRYYQIADENNEGVNGISITIDHDIKDPCSMKMGKDGVVQIAIHATDVSNGQTITVTHLNDSILEPTDQKSFTVNKEPLAQEKIWELQGGVELGVSNLVGEVEEGLEICLLDNQSSDSDPEIISVSRKALLGGGLSASAKVGAGVQVAGVVGAEIGAGAGAQIIVGGFARDKHEL